MYIANSTGFFKVSQIYLIESWPQLPHLQITGVGPTSMMNDVSQRYIQFHANTLPLRCFDKWIMQSTNFRVVTGKQKSKYSPVKPWCTTTSRARSTHAFQIGVQLFCLPERMQQHKARKLWDTKESQCPIWGTVQEPVSIMVSCFSTIASIQKYEPRYLGPRFMYSVICFLVGGFNHLEKY